MRVLSLLVILTAGSGCAETHPPVEASFSSASVDGATCEATAAVRIGYGTCDSIGDPVATQLGPNIHIDVPITDESGGETCLMMLLEETVTVPLGRLRAGRYQLLVEGEFGDDELALEVPASCR